MLPKTSKSFIYCPFPINFDVYKGCSHACKYCFANNARFSKKTTDERLVECVGTVKDLENFCVKRKREALSSWCDWDIPICFGRNSDPFQPCEKKHKLALQCLKFFARTGYPFIVTTKSVMLAEDPEYFSVIKDCNVVVQLSLSCPELDKLEQGAATYEQRLAALAKLSPVVPRTVARWQPLFLEYLDSALRQVRRVAETGAYHILAQTAYLDKPTKLCNWFDHGHYHYPIPLVEKAYTRIRAKCHAYGLKFMCSDMKRMGDEMPCCVGKGLEDKGFAPCKCNAPYYYLCHGEYEVRPNMKKSGTGAVFHNLYFQKDDYSKLKLHSFQQLMEDAIIRTSTKIGLERG